MVTQIPSFKRECELSNTSDIHPNTLFNAKTVPGIFWVNPSSQAVIGKPYKTPKWPTQFQMQVNVIIKGQDWACHSLFAQLLRPFFGIFCLFNISEWYLDASETSHLGP